MPDDHVPAREIVDVDAEGNPRPGPASYSAAGQIDPRIASLVAFLLARLDEREAKANAAKRFHPTPWHVDPAVETTMESGRWVADANDDGVLVANGDAPARFYADNDPQFVLDDIAAKRQIVELYAEHAEYDDPDNSYEHATGRICGLGEAVRLLALPFADHPDYREEWKP